MSDLTKEEQPLIRVMIVDDHSMVRSGLATFIQVMPDLEFVGEAKNGERAVQKCDQVRPDVILMDLVMPIMNGVEATRAIRQKCPEIQVIALTSFHEVQRVKDALKAGAISYLLKDVSMNELATASGSLCRSPDTRSRGDTGFDSGRKPGPQTWTRLNFTRAGSTGSHRRGVEQSKDWQAVKHQCHNRPLPCQQYFLQVEGIQPLRSDYAGFAQ